jgi:hypothetical protein
VEERRALRPDAADDPSALSLDLEAIGRGRSPTGGSRIRDEGARGSLNRSVRPARSPPRHSSNARPPRRTRRSVRPASGPSLR